MTTQTLETTTLETINVRLARATQHLLDLEEDPEATREDIEDATEVVTSLRNEANYLRFYNPSPSPPPP